ncbi:hypothetical protein Vafri_20112 [Volvox africanus]|uniref:P-type ATPase C-terminal domain-containing protein n=1 Tax=Volvox africanus TaxID=51714 RepID=A0A8J4BRS2_9CHLO|nr:hypothetical protein Vafri_20112 [Volvox africanus]
MLAIAGGHDYKVSASSHRLDELEKSGSKELAEALAAELVAKQLEEIETCLKVSGSYSVRSNDGVANAALIIDGKALSYALAPAVAPLLLCVGLRCSAVVCCRVSPLQKSQVTALVRAGGSITLAIGDGANDVGMIQRAHIGVGISGQEGMQAVMSSDFAIAQFRFLVPLLLVHGQYSYRRLSRMISFFFYKNLLFALTLFTYSAFTTFSGSYIYNDTSMTLFNVVFTSATPLVIGMFDRHLAKSSLLHYPQLYRCGVANEAFSLGRIAAWLAAAAVQAGVLLAMVLVGASGTAASGPEGIPYGMAQVGAVLFTAVLLTVHLQLAILEEEWTVLHHAAIWGSLGIWFLYLLCFGALPVSWSLEMWQLFRTIVGPSAQLWLLVVVIPVVAVLPVMAIKEFKRLLFPSDEDVIREMSTLNGQRKQQQRRLGLQQHRSQHRHQQQQKERQKLDQRLEKGPEIDELKPGMRIETKDQQKQRQQQPQDGQEQQPPVGPHIGRVQQVGQQQGLPSPQPPSRLASFHEAISKGFSSGKCMLGRGSGRGLFGSHRIAPDSQAAFAAAEVSAAVKSDVAVTAAASPAGDAITSPSIAAADAFGIEATATTTTAPGPVATPSTASKGGRSSHDSPVAEVNSPRGGSGTAGAALVPATAGGDMVAAADSDGGGGRVTGSGAVNSDDTVVVREPQALALSFSADPSEIIMAALGGARPPPLPEPLPLLVTVSGSTGTNAGGSATLSTRGRHSSLVARPDWRKPLLSWGQTNKGLRGPGAKFVISSGSSGGMPPGLLPGDSVSAAGGEDAGISERPRAVSLPPGAAEPQIKSAAVLAALPAPSKPRRISLLTPVLSLPRGGSLSPMTSLPRVPSFPPMSSFRASAVGSGASISTISGMLPTTATSVSPIPRGLGEGRNPSPEPAALQEREGSHCTGGRPVTPRQLGAAPSADWPPVLPVPIAALPPTTETPQLFFAKLKYSTSSYCSSTRSPSPPIAAATAAVRRLAEEAVGAARNEPMAAFDATSAAEAEGMGSAAGVNTAAISFTRVRSLHRTSDGRFTESSLSGRITESGIIQLTSGLLQGHAGPDTDSGMLLGRDSEPSSQMSLALLQGDGVRDAMLALDDVSS